MPPDRPAWLRSRTETFGPPAQVELTRHPVPGAWTVRRRPYYDWSGIDPVWRERGVFPILSERALRATLGILDRTLTRPAYRPAG